MGPDTWQLGLTFGVLPAFVAGLGVFLICCPFVHWHLPAPFGFRGHVNRCGSLYLLAGVLTILILSTFRNGDFGMFSQFLISPAAVAVGAIMADLITAVGFHFIRGPATDTGFRQVTSSSAGEGRTSAP